MAGSVAAAASLPLDRMARRLQYELDVDYDGFVTNEDSRGPEAPAESAAIVALAGNQRLDFKGLVAFMRRYDTRNVQSNANTPDGKIDDTEFAKLILDITHMVEHQNPSLSMPIAELAAGLVQQLDQDRNGTLNNVDAALEPAVRALLTLARQPSLNNAGMATLLRTYDKWHGANNREGADGKIGPAEFNTFATDVERNMPAQPGPPRP